MEEAFSHLSRIQSIWKHCSSLLMILMFEYNDIRATSDLSNFCCIAMASVIIRIRFEKDIISVICILIHIINVKSKHLKAYLVTD